VTTESKLYLLLQFVA